MSTKSKSSNSSMYTDTPCDKCGGPTLQIGQGSIWCPDEDAHPGGHFVVRVAFARPPSREALARGDWPKQPAKRQPLPVPARRASEPTAKPVTVKPANDGFDTGFDGFVDSES
jgi:uncharacterized Zn finger protein (UPF0148 family)